MAKVDANEFKNRKPQLSIDDLEGGEYIALTLANVDRLEAGRSEEDGLHVRVVR